METKICNKCLLEKPILEFNKRSNAKDGFRYECKSCQKLNYQNKREYYIGKMKENRINKLDDYTKRDKNYYEANRNEILKKKRQYHIDNQEKILKKAKEYYYKNKDKKSTYNRQWIKDNIIYYREYQKNY